MKNHSKKISPYDKYLIITKQSENTMISPVQ